MKCKFEWYGMPCEPDKCNFIYCEYNANRRMTVEEMEQGYFNSRGSEQKVNEE